MRAKWFLMIVLLLMASAGQAQQDAGRVTRTQGTADNPISIDLGRLDVGDTVEVEVIRLSGNLVPIVALVNRDANRISYRYRDTDQDGRLNDTTFTLNADAGAGRYELVVAADPEVLPQSTGDFIIVYALDREVEEPSPAVAEETPCDLEELERNEPLIVIAASEDITLQGAITNDVPRVDFLICLEAPVTFELAATGTGDLIPLIGFSPAETLDFRERGRIFDTGGTIISGVFPPDDLAFEPGYYRVAVSRQGVEEGTTTGGFVLDIAR